MRRSQVHTVCFDLERRSPAFVGWDLYRFRHSMLIDTASSNELGIEEQIGHHIGEINHE